MSSRTRQAWARSVIGVAAGLLGRCALSCGAVPSAAGMTCPPGMLGAALGNSAGLCSSLGSWSCSTPGFGGLLKAANSEMSRMKRKSKRKSKIKENKKERTHYIYWQNFMEIPRVRCFGVSCARHIKVSDATKWRDITLLHCGMCNVENCRPNRYGHKPSSMA